MNLKNAHLQNLRFLEKALGHLQDDRRDITRRLDEMNDRIQFVQTAVVEMRQRIEAANDQHIWGITEKDVADLAEGELSKDELTEVIRQIARLDGSTLNEQVLEIIEAVKSSE